MTCFLFAAPASAVNLGLAKEDGGQPGAFLNFAASARSLGMGKAHTALADDASASYWNPAGLAQLERKDVVALYSSLELDTNYGFFGYAQPAANYGTFDVGVVTLRSGGYDKRTGPGINDMAGTFDINQSALLLSHGIKIHPKWAVGGTLKVVREEIDRYTGTGFGFDPGLMWSISPKWQSGFLIRNLVAPRLKLKSTSDVYPRELRMGIKFQPREKFILAADAYKVENAQAKLSLGAEWKPYRLLALRAGLNDTEITAGLGFQFGDWGIDYAFGYNAAAPSGTENFEQSHRFGIHLSFGRNITTEERALFWQKKGQDILAELKAAMNSETEPDPKELENLLSDAKVAMQHKAFPDPKDLYLTQGYVYFFERKYDKSTEYLGEALSLINTKDDELEKHYQKAKLHLSEAEAQALISAELKKTQEAYDKGDYRAAIGSSLKILKIDPANIEAKAYLENADKRLREPIETGLKIAQAKMEKGQYLEALKDLSGVQKIDPENKTAMDLVQKSLNALEKAQNYPGSRVVEEISPDQSKSREFYSQGLLLYSRGDISGAVKAWESALQYNGQNQAARNAYNRALIELKETQQ